jgi:transposase
MPTSSIFYWFRDIVLLVGILKRAILLQSEATVSKLNRLRRFSREATDLANRLLASRKSKRLMDLHREMYRVSIESTGFNSQVVCDVIRGVVKSKGRSLKGLIVKFNVPRNCVVFETKSKFFVRLGLYPDKRIPVPIKKNRNFQRFRSLLVSGWTCKTYGLTPDQQIVAYFSKDETVLPNRKNVLGVDVNSKCFTASVLSPVGKVLKQVYFGKDIWMKRNRLMKRKAFLQSLADTGSWRAAHSLQRLKRSERNFIKNRIGEVVRDITNLAVKFDADIAIEDLKRFSPLGKRYNREVLKIPFFVFRHNLTARCFDKQIGLVVVDPYHTSKWCTHCGAVARKGHSTNYSLFACECGQIVNSDRKASLAIAVKSLSERSIHDSNQTGFFQFSDRRVPVNGLYRSNAEVGFRAVHSESTFKECPPL